VSKKSERSDRMKLIAERLAKANIGGGRSWKPRPGDNFIRIMEAVGDMGIFWVNVGQHWLTSQQPYTCPNYTLGEKCPICELVAELFSDGSEESKKIARRIKMNQRYVMNVISRGYEAAGPQIYYAPPTVFAFIEVLMKDPQYTDFDQGLFVFDTMEGRDINVKRVGTDRNSTRYTVVPAARDTALAADQATIDQWFEQALDLTPVLLSEDPSEDTSFTHDEFGGLVYPISVEPYARLEKVIAGTSLDDIDVGDNAEPEEEESDLPFPDEEEKKDEVDEAIQERRRRSSRTAARTRRTRR